MESFCSLTLLLRFLSPAYYLPTSFIYLIYFYYSYNLLWFRRFWFCFWDLHFTRQYQIRILQRCGIGCCPAKSCLPSTISTSTVWKPAHTGVESNQNFTFIFIYKYLLLLLLYYYYLLIVTTNHCHFVITVLWFCNYIYCCIHSGLFCA